MTLAGAKAKALMSIACPKTLKTAIQRINKSPFISGVCGEEHYDNAHRNETNETGIKYCRVRMIVTAATR